ncbi:MAG: carbonate dehydratase [Alphaproteobacteria bacterium]|jgi:carbonic anhydrase|nr:carbonate dehydratase [Alphaproteobacteria bacterium]
MSRLDDVFERNRLWAERIKEGDPDFFVNLAEQQSPEYLWIGCADSRVPANQIMDLPPGGVFVHRNIANVVVPTDLNCLSVLQYGVWVLQVKHIIVCGHHGCGGVKAAMTDEDHGLIDNWLQHIRQVRRSHATAFREDLDEDDAVDLLCELNVVEQTRNVCRTTIVRGAWARGNDLTVHGWVYSIKNGVLKSLCRHEPGASDLEIDPDASIARILATET